MTTARKITDTARINKLFGNYPKPTIWQNANGTWSHHKDSKRKWAERSACETDLRFALEWAKA